MLIKKVVFNFRQLRSEDTIESLQREAIYNFLDLVDTCYTETTNYPVTFTPIDLKKHGTPLNVNFENILIELPTQTKLFEQIYFERYESQMSQGTTREEDEVILERFYKLFDMGKQGGQWKPLIVLRLITIDGKAYSFYTVEPF